MEYYLPFIALIVVSAAVGAFLAQRSINIKYQELLTQWFEADGKYKSYFRKTDELNKDVLRVLFSLKGSGQRVYNGIDIVELIRHINNNKSNLK